MPSLRSIDRRLLTILLIVFVQMLGSAMILPILPLYAQREFNLPPEQITLLISAFFAAQFFAGPYLGRLSDQIGRLPVLIISQIGTVLSFLMLALAPSAIFLYIARILDGITGGNIIVAQAYITDITPSERRTEALGYTMAAFGIGFIIGPAIGGFLSATFGPRVPYLIASGAALLTVLLTWLTLDETLTPETRHVTRQQGAPKLHPVEVIRNTPLIIIMIVGFVGQFAMGMLQSIFALFAEAVLFRGYSGSAVNLGIGLLFTVIGMGQLVAQVFLLKRMVQRFGEAPLVILGSLLRASGLLVFALNASPYLAMVSGLLFATGMGLMMPSLQSLATRTVLDELRGAVLGLYQSSLSLATIISTAIAGLLFAMNPFTPFWVGATLSLLVVLPALALLHQARIGRLAHQLAEERPASSEM